MGSVFKVVTPVSTEPITLTDAKAYLRVDFSDDDAVIAGIITRARSFAETVTGRALATQQIQQVDTIARPDGGVLSGPIKEGPNWYIYNEQLGANPFGPAQYYHDLAMPPIQASQPITVQTRITAFDNWVDYDLSVNPYFIDDTSEPARFYFSNPITANFWKFVYWTGYTSTYPIPPDLMQCLYECVSYWYDYRDGGGDANRFQQIQMKLLAKRVSWV